jgi:protein TonB
LQVTIGADGVPQEIHIVKGLDPGLDLQAIEAVGKWRFKPAIEDDKPVAFQATIEISFRLL